MVKYIENKGIIFNVECTHVNLNGIKETFYLNNVFPLYFDHLPLPKNLQMFFMHEYDE